VEVLPRRSRHGFVRRVAHECVLEDVALAAHPAGWKISPLVARSERVVTQGGFVCATPPSALRSEIPAQHRGGAGQVSLPPAESPSRRAVSRSRSVLGITTGATDANGSSALRSSPRPSTRVISSMNSGMPSARRMISSTTGLDSGRPCARPAVIISSTCSWPGAGGLHDRHVLSRPGRRELRAGGEHDAQAQRLAFEDLGLRTSWTSNPARLESSDRPSAGPRAPTPAAPLRPSSPAGRATRW
jgi:hypothetical protein